MSDPFFEHHIGRLFAEPQAFADQAAFTASVQARLERNWAMRRILIGTAGVVGGLITTAQVVGANLVQRVGIASRGADGRVHDLAATLIARGQTTLAIHALSISGEALWMVAGLAAVGVALVAARLMDAS